jgi:cytoskeletal protein RodZ
MRINNKRPNPLKRRPSKFLIALLVIVFVVAGIGLYWYMDSNGFFGLSNKETTKKSGENAKKTDQNNSDTPASDANDDNNSDEQQSPTQNELPDDGQVDFAVWVTANEVSNGVLTLRVQLNENPSSGTCTLNIGNYSETVNVLPGPQAASCEGFDVPTNKFSGKTFTITVKSGDKTASTKGAI